MRALTLLVSLCLFGGSTVAQTSWFPAGPENSTTAPGTDPRERGDGTEPPVPEGVAVGSTRECIILATTRPSRIPPGGSGLLTVTMALTGDAVITADSDLELLYTQTQGSLTLGAHSLRPAKHLMGPGPLQGQAVYDQSVILEVPVSVAVDAKDGEHVAGLRVEFELKNGRSGFSKGRFVTGVSTKVRVGEPLPMFAAQAGYPVVTPSEPPGLQPRRAGETHPGSGPDGVSRVGRGVLGEPSEGPDDLGSPVPPGPPGFSLQVPVALWAFLGAGGLALLATLGMLLARALRSRGA